MVSGAQSRRHGSREELALSGLLTSLRPKSLYLKSQNPKKAVFGLRLLLKSHGPPPQPPTTFNQSVAVSGVVSVQERPHDLNPLTLSDPL